MAFLETLGRSGLQQQIPALLNAKLRFDQFKIQKEERAAKQAEKDKKLAEDAEQVDIRTLGLPESELPEFIAGLGGDISNQFFAPRGLIRKNFEKLAENDEAVGKIVAAKFKEVESKALAQRDVVKNLMLKDPFSPKIADERKKLDLIERELSRTATAQTKHTAASREKELQSFQEAEGLFQRSQTLGELSEQSVTTGVLTPERQELAGIAEAQLADPTAQAFAARGDLEKTLARDVTVEERLRGAGVEVGLAADKRISTIDLAFEIARLEPKEKDGSISDSEKIRLRDAKRTLAISSTQIPGLKTTSRVTAKEEAELDFVITPNKRGRTLDPKTFQSVPPGTTNRQANELGAVVATESQVKEFSEFGKVRGIVDVVGTLALKAIKATNAVEAFAQGTALKAGAITRANAVAATYDAERSAFIGVLSRSLAAERGVLTEGDIQRIKRAFPSLRDTKEIAEFKMGFINFMIANAEFAVKQQVFGLLNDERYEDRKEQLFNTLEAFRDPDRGDATPESIVGPDSTDEEIEQIFNRVNKANPGATKEEIFRIMRGGK